MPFRDLEWGASVQRGVIASRARECSFGNPSRIFQVLVSEGFEASATIDVHCTTARERTATPQATEYQRIFSFRCREHGTCLAAAKHLKKHLKEKERARAIWALNWKGFPWCCPSLTHRVVMIRSLTLRVPALLVASLLDALVCGFVAVCESRLACRFV